MELLFYSMDSQGDAQRAQSAIEALVSGRQLVVCRSIEALKRRLMRPRSGLGIGVLFLSGGEELLRVVALEEFMDDLRMIAIVPCGRPDMVAQVLKLRPRFFTYANSDFSDVVAVLSKMLQAGAGWGGQRRGIRGGGRIPQEPALELEICDRG